METYQEKIQKMFEARCDSVFIESTPDELIQIRAINDRNFIEPYFQAEVLRNPNDNRYCYYISMESPKYMIEPDVKLSDKEKNYLITLVDKYWGTLISLMNDNCVNGCAGRDCEIFRNKKIPSVPPDYRLL